MEVKSIGFLGEHNEREGEMRGVQRDTDENPPLRAGTDMIMGEPLVVVYHSAPPPGCSTELKHTFSQLLVETASRPFEVEYFWAGSCEQPFSSGALSYPVFGCFVPLGLWDISSINGSNQDFIVVQIFCSVLWVQIRFYILEEEFLYWQGRGVFVPIKYLSFLPCLTF